MDSKNYLYVLVAASAVGKSVLIKQMCNEGLWKTIPKYSTRNNRGKDDDVVKITNNEIDIAEKSGDANAIKYARLKYIKNICGEGKGAVYYKNNNIYGICFSDIKKLINKSNLAVVVSDFHAISEIKSYPALKGKVKVIYIGSTIDERKLLERFKARENTDFDELSDKTLITIKNIRNMCSILSSASRLKYLEKIEEVLPLLNEQWNNYVPYFETIKIRSTNIRMLYNRYIDNISVIDYAILNFYDLDYMFMQARNIINHPKSSNRNHKIHPPVFMVCAAPSSGKATLMEIVGELGEVNDSIAITKKYAKREPRKTDGRDGMIAIGKNSSFKSCCDDTNKLWTWHFHGNQNTEYAVNVDEIQKNINKGKAQIFISNISQIEKGRELFPNNLVVLYLHATHESATYDHICEKRKSDLGINIKSNNPDTMLESNIELETIKTYKEMINDDLKEIKKIHYDFANNNYDIDHVLLNTGTREDLIEQMLNLLAYYS